MKRERERIKKRIKDAEIKIGVGQIDGRNVARVYWGSDELYTWYLSNGEIEKITDDEYIARGGIFISWDDNDQ